MVNYNPKDWVKLILQFHKNDTMRMLLPAMLVLGAFTGLAEFLIKDVFEVDYKSSPIVHSLLGFVISLLLVFRTNTGYDRWWEGRKLWGGFVNSSRNLCIKLNAFLPVDDSALRRKMRVLLSNYFFAAKSHLRNQTNEDEWDTYEGFDAEEFATKVHTPNAFAAQLMIEINEQYRRGHLTDPQLLVLTEELRNITDNMGACERIRNTPIPYSYNMFLKKVIFIYSITLPFGLLTDFGYWSVLCSMFIFYAFASLELLAEEIEDPFGTDANDLPTDDLAKKIRENLKEIIGE
ncbi:MAG: hypothetical protein FD123_1703 [Bacteroidetes bacterium]|nr:MAG: hypothetical protein FD123_1703 [Bacteroidota bacterium]